MIKESVTSHASANRGFLAALASALFLGSSAIFIRYLTANFNMPALVLTFWREALVAAGLALFFLLFNPARLRGLRPHWPYLLGYGAVLAVFNAALAYSVALNGASVAVVLLYASVAFTAVLGWLLLGEPLGWPKIAAVVLTLAGCVLVTNALNPSLWALNAAGILAGLLAALGKAAYSLLGRSAAQRGLNPWSTQMAIFSVAALLLLFANLIFGSSLSGSALTQADFFLLGKSLPGWAALITLAYVPTLFGYGMYNVSLKHLPASVANLVVSIEPVLTASLAYIFFGEVLTPAQLLGGVLVLGGVLLSRISG